MAVASEFSIQSPFGRKLILLKKYRGEGMERWWREQRLGPWAGVSGRVQGIFL